MGRRLVGGAGDNCAGGVFLGFAGQLCKLLVDAGVLGDGDQGFVLCCCLWASGDYIILAFDGNVCSHPQSSLTLYLNTKYR